MSMVKIRKPSSASGDCPICGDRTSLFFSVPCDYRKPTNSECYEVDWCNRCDYGQVVRRFSEESIPGFYDVHDYYTHATSQSQSDQKMDSFFDRVRTHLSWRLDNGEDFTPLDAMALLKRGNHSACEIGCGNGGNLLKFVEHGFSVVGIEPDPAARDAAKKMVSDIFAGTAEKLPALIREKQFDVVLMSHVLEHCFDINIALANAKRILKSKGVLIVETPNCKAHGFKDYQGEWPWTDIPRHLNFFTPSSLHLVLKKHSFRVVAIKYSGFYRQFANSWLKNEEEIWRAFADSYGERVAKPNFKLRAWKLLLKSILSTKESKYDSVRLIALNS